MKQLLTTTLLFFCLIFIACFQKSNSPQLYKISGNTMGTTYNISYYSSKKMPLKNSVDSLLQVINLSTSTYIKESTISKFNNFKSTKNFKINDYHFEQVYNVANFIYKNTFGNFDPTVMPLVNFWGFGPNKKVAFNQSKLQQIVNNQIGFKKIKWTKNELKKSHKNIEIDFSAIAKGYGVDEVSNLLLSKNIQNHLVEIGGEVVANGTKPHNINWKLGIDKPDNTLKNRQLQKIVALQNKAMATSGNYRNYKIKDGKKVVHTINPKTGYSEISNLLSATVIANDCATADAFATAFMVMGLQKTKQYLKSERKFDLQVFLIFNDKKTNEIDTWQSKNFTADK